MQQNLAHIDAGKTISELPCEFESVTMQSKPSMVEPASEDQPVSSPQAKQIVDVSEQISQQKPVRGFIQRLRNWLNSPWSKSWKDTK